MIRINLLPVREARRAANMRQQGLLLGGVIGIAVLTCVWMHVSIKGRQAGEQRRIAEAQVELKSLDATRKQVEQFRKEKEEIEQKLQVIASLESSRQGPVRLMDEIASRIPKRMWLTDLAMLGGRVELKGVSLDAEIVAAFLASLAESPYFTGVELDETRLAETEGLKLNTFSIHSQYSVPDAVTLTNGPAPGGKPGPGARR